MIMKDEVQKVFKLVQNNSALDFLKNKKNLIKLFNDHQVMDPKNG